MRQWSEPATRTAPWLGHNVRLNNAGPAREPQSALLAAWNHARIRSPRYWRVASQRTVQNTVKRKMPALNALKAFEAAGTTGSFTRAAELLNVTQSAVSRQVRQLEEQLGETLFSRRHQHLVLTASGRLLLRALQQADDKIVPTVRT